MGIYGGAICVEANTLSSFSGISNFIHNSAVAGGTMSIADNVAVTFNGTNNFIGNSASNIGGAIIATENISLEQVTSVITQQETMVVQLPQIVM